MTLELDKTIDAKLRLALAARVVTDLGAASRCEPLATRPLVPRPAID
jgi:hypothetical protein